MLLLWTYSFFIYERPMPDMSSETFILALKTIFIESGVPNILITDNGRQYCSEEFKKFSLEWSFVHKTSSPYYLKGNSYVERVVKEIYSKCKDDFLLELLVHRSTPLLYPNAKSPAELFLGCKISTNISYIPSGTAALMHHSRSDDHDLLFFNSFNSLDIVYSLKDVTQDHNNLFSLTFVS